MRRSAATVLGLALLLAPATARGQDSLPQASSAQAFRAGQWAAEFGSYSGFFGIGAIRFTSPTAAWTLSSEFQFDDRGQNDPTRSVRLRANVGRRWYGPIRDRVRTTRALGVFGSIDNERFPSGPDIATNDEVIAGAFAEIGGQIFILPEMSIGATWRGQAFYTRLHQELDSGPENTSQGINLGLGSINVVGAIYF